MPLPEPLSRLSAALRRLGAAGARLWRQDAALEALRAELEASPAPALVALSARIARAQGAQIDTLPPEALSLLSLSRAVAIVQLPAAPQGPLHPLPAPQDQALRSQRVSITHIARARGILEEAKYNQLWRLPDTLWADLRLSTPLLKALDLKRSPKTTVMNAIQLQAQWSAITQMFGGSSAGDILRLQLLHAGSPPRAHEVARRLLSGKSASPKLRAAAHHCLIDAEAGLPFLLAGAAQGPLVARQGAFTALAQRAEPEALQAVLTELGRPSPEYKGGPRSYWLLREALPYITAPAARARMRAGLREGVDSEDPSAERDKPWTRYLWAKALLAGPVDDTDRAALSEVQAEDWLEPPTLRRLWEVSTAQALRAQLHREHRELPLIGQELLILRAMEKLSPEELFDHLAPGLAEDPALQHVLLGHSWVTRGGKAWSSLLDEERTEFLSSITLDARWWGRAKALQIPRLVGALLPPEPQATQFAIRWLETPPPEPQSCGFQFQSDVKWLLSGLLWTGAELPAELKARLFKDSQYPSEVLLSLLAPSDLSWLDLWVEAELARPTAERHKALPTVKRRLAELRAQLSPNIDST